MKMGEFKKNFMYLILMIVLGILISNLYTILQTENQYTTLSKIYEQRNELNKIQEEFNKIQLEKEELEKEVNKFNELDEEQIIKELESNIEKVKVYSGLTDLTGPGVIIIINDSKVIVQNREASSLIVHDFDIQNIITDLKNSGAEAISVNEERVVVGKSKIKCAGPTIQINDKVVGQPFIIKAIGDKYFLEAAINSPNGYASVLREWDIFIEVNTSVNVRIPKYDGELGFNYLENYEEEN
jgi:uncharacterized protein YlxW (UPF0749 family)